MPADVDAAHAAIVTAVAAGNAAGGAPGRGGRARGHHDDLARPDRHAGAAAALLRAAAASVSARVSAAAVTVLPGNAAGPLVPGRRPGDGRDGPGPGAVCRRCQGRPGIALGAGPLVTLDRLRRRPAGGDIAVALDAPWPLAGLRRARRRWHCTAGRPGAFDALAGRAGRQGDGPRQAARRRRTLPAGHRLPLTPPPRAPTAVLRASQTRDSATVRPAGVAAGRRLMEGCPF